MKYLLDTHVWLWYLLGNNQLSNAHKELISNSDSELWLSPISLWETCLLIEKGRLPILEPRDSWIAKAMQQLSVRESALNFEIALKARQLSDLHEDPADRFIAATAAVYDLTLLTSDVRLLKGAGYASF